MSPSYWGGRSARSKANAALTPPLARAAQLDAGMERDEDVVAEERRMQDLLQHRTGGAAGRTGGGLGWAGQHRHGRWAALPRLHAGLAASAQPATLRFAATRSLLPAS